MNDMSSTITAKSDQLNSDDLISGPITIEITDAKVMMAEQPCVISYRGDNGKPWKPGKSMRRVLVAAWGTDPKAYIGRFLTLYRDPDVQFGGVKVGGTRISHMSHINGALTTSLTVTRGSKKPFQVKPLVVDQAKRDDTPKALTADEVEDLKNSAFKAASQGSDALKAWWSSAGAANQKAVGGAEALATLKVAAQNADAAKSAAPQTASTAAADEETPFDV